MRCRSRILGLGLLSVASSVFSFPNQDSSRIIIIYKQTYTIQSGTAIIHTSNSTYPMLYIIYYYPNIAVADSNCCRSIMSLHESKTIFTLLVSVAHVT